MLIIIREQSNADVRCADTDVEEFANTHTDVYTAYLPDWYCGQETERKRSIHVDENNVIYILWVPGRSYAACI